VAVRWPDGSFTGSVRVPAAPAPVEEEPEPEKQEFSAVKPEPRKEVSDDAR
jgi:hypothetical protein